MSRRGPTHSGDEIVILPRARRAPSIALMPVVVGTGLLYGVVASQSAFLGQSFLTVCTLTLLFIVASSMMVLGGSGDRLALFRIASLYFLLAFCIGPLFVPGDGIYFFEHPRGQVLDWTAVLALGCYVMTAIGYHLPLFPPRPAEIRARYDQVRRGPVVAFALALFAIGVVSWFGLVMGAGGIGNLFFSHVSRTAFFEGRGFLFWPMLFMVPGGVLYFAAQVSRHRSWRAAWPLVIAFLLLLALQGRHRAIGPLLMGVVVSHYLIRPIRLLRFLAVASVGLFVLMVVGVARSPSIRAEFVANPLAGVAGVALDLGDHLESLMVVDVSRIPEVMVVVDKVPARMPYDWGSSLLIFLNPLRRLLPGGPSILGPQVEPVGGRLYPLARPDLPVMETGFLPSIVGEMRANFPSLLAVPVFLLYGIALRFVYQRTILSRPDYTSVALYAVTGFFFVNMVEGTFGQNLFELIVEMVPLVAIRFLTRVHVPRAVVALRSEGIPPR